MIVESLRRQHFGQVAFVSGRLLQLGPLVLEPDLDLSLVQSQLGGQGPPPFLGQVAVVVKLLSQSGQLLGGEGGSRSLFVGGLVGAGGSVSLLDLASSGTWNMDREKEKTISRQHGKFDLISEILPTLRLNLFVKCLILSNPPSN